MRISRSAWRKYQDAHRGLQDAAKQELEAYFDTLPWDADERRALELLQARAIELAERYGTADALLSSAFYVESMAAQGVSVDDVELSQTMPLYVGEDVVGAVAKAKTPETAKSLAGSALSGHVKRAGIETMRSAAIRDRAMWAWVCIGDTCAFCRAVGSRGWQQASRSILAGNHAEHIHDNCDCQFVVKAPGQTLEIEGYDPDALLREYESAEGKTSKDIINAMRRNDYTPEFADQRNARRRELYAMAHKPDESAT